MKLTRFIFFCILLPAFSLFAVPYDMILTGDPVLEDLRYLSLESGKSFLSFTTPLAPAEVEQFLDSIDASDLSAAALQAYNRARQKLSPEAPLSLSSDNFSLFLNINSTIEARTRFNADISWEPEYPKIPPLLSFPTRFFFADSFQLYFEPLVSADPEYYCDADIFGINIPYKTDHFDANLPLRAFAAMGGSWWNFQLGRDRLSYGNGQLGNLSVSDTPAFYEYMRFSFFTNYFKYSVLVSQMPLDIKDIYSIPAESGMLRRTNQRHFYLHRLDFTLFNFLSVGLMEGLMVGNSPLEIRYLNPLAVYHSFYSSWQYDDWTGNEMGHMNGSFFSVEANWNIINSLAAYGQFAMNEFSTSHELNINPNQPPNGLGFLAGLRYSHSFDDWASMFFIEYIYTYPYLYMNSSPFASLINMRNLSLSRNRFNYYYIGYPRDTIALTLGTKFLKDDVLSISGDFSWFSRGEHTGSIAYDWERTASASGQKTPSGTAENRFVVSVAAEWKLFPFLAFNAGLSGIVSLNNMHESGSDEFGGQAAISVSFRY